MKKVVIIRRIFKRYKTLAKLHKDHDVAINLTAQDFGLSFLFVKNVIESRTDPLFVEQFSDSDKYFENIKKLPKIP